MSAWSLIEGIKKHISLLTTVRLRKKQYNIEDKTKVNFVNSLSLMYNRRVVETTKNATHNLWAKR